MNVMAQGAGIFLCLSRWAAHRANVLKGLTVNDLFTRRVYVLAGELNGN
jgi:hypothetical protein